MRKITIPVSALLAVVSTSASFAETIKVTFPSTSMNLAGEAAPVTISGFTFVGNGNNAKIDKNGFSTGGGSTGTTRHIYFTPSKNGVLTVSGSASGDNTDRHIFVATAPGGNADAVTVMGKVAIPKKGEKHTLKVSGLVAGTTYYICLQGNGTINAISYEESTPSKSLEVTVKSGKDSGSGNITLNKGTYKITAAEGTLTVKDGDAVMADNNAVVVAKNGTVLEVSVKLGSKPSSDKKIEVTAAVSDASLNEVKSVYTQKIAVMINKANQYTNDARLQQDALAASSLMAEANNMGLAQYDEYMTTGKVASLETKIANLTATINNDKAAYDGYAYAQEKYGNKYENGAWVLDESNTTSLLYILLR